MLQNPPRAFSFARESGFLIGYGFQDKEVISIERSTYEELHPRLLALRWCSGEQARNPPAPYQGTSKVEQMKKMASRGTDKKLGDWLDNQDVCQMLNISPRTLQTLRDNGTLAYSQINHKVYYKPEDVKGILSLVNGRGKSNCTNLNRSAYE